MNEIQKQRNLNLAMLKPDISCFKNCVDPDQLASQKPADQDPHCFLICLLIHAYGWTPLS